MYNVVVKKVHVRYLISWWVSCLSYDAIGYQIRNARLEIQIFSWKGITTEIFGGKISDSIFSTSSNLILFYVWHLVDNPTAYRLASFCPSENPPFLALGLTPQNSNPHNFRPEVDIDFVPMAFIIVPRVLKRDVVKFHQVAPPHIFAPPLFVKPPYLGFLSIRFCQNLPIDSTPGYYRQAWALDRSKLLAVRGSMAMHKTKSKQEIEFQYGGRPFS